MILEKIRQKASENLQHIILPEGEDVRTVQAAEICAREKLPKLPSSAMRKKCVSLANETNSNLNGVEILDHRKSDEFGRVAQFYHELRRAKGVTLGRSRTNRQRSALLRKSAGEIRKSRRLGRGRDEYDGAHGRRRDSLYRRSGRF